MTLPIDRVLPHLKGIRKSGAQYVGLCPAHDDHRPSLSLTIGDDGRVLLHCHAGCEPPTICAAMGLNLKDLFPDQRDARGRGTAGRRIVGTYDYCDEDGELLFQTVRFEPKDFKQRRRGEGGKWVWSLKGVRRVLYRLPELIAASAGQWVFAVEGEKDADGIATIGLVATTCPMGALKWKHVDDTALVGRRVVILPDKDDKGKWVVCYENPPSDVEWDSAAPEHGCPGCGKKQIVVLEPTSSTIGGSSSGRALICARASATTSRSAVYTAQCRENAPKRALRLQDLPSSKRRW